MILINLKRKTLQNKKHDRIWELHPEPPPCQGGALPLS